MRVVGPAKKLPAGGLFAAEFVDPSFSSFPYTSTTGGPNGLQSGEAVAAHEVQLGEISAVFAEQHVLNVT
jgi:hypothetical protein